jgi:hypothetical protein
MDAIGVEHLKKALYPTYTVFIRSYAATILSNIATAEFT